MLCENRPPTVEFESSGAAADERAGFSATIEARALDVPHERDATEVLDRDFLEIRAKLLEIAASLDRITRAPGRRVDPDPRLAQIHQAIDALLRPDPDRAETIQLIFSLPYNEAWQDVLELAIPRRN